MTEVVPERVKERFMSKVNINGPNGCWLWTDRLSPDGYGQFTIVTGRTVGAHRASLFIFQGHPLNTGHRLQADHLCRNSSCVNPGHLEIVTPKENMRRQMSARGLADACGKGHVLDERNAYWYRGYRYCRACHAERNRLSVKRRLDAAKAGGAR